MATKKTASKARPKKPRSKAPARREASRPAAPARREISAEELIEKVRERLAKISVELHPDVVAHLRAWATLLRETSGMPAAEAWARIERRAPGQPPAREPPELDEHRHEVNMLLCRAQREWRCVHFVGRFDRLLDTVANLLDAALLVGRGDREGAERCMPELRAFHGNDLIQAGLLGIDIELDTAVIAHLRSWVGFLRGDSKIPPRSPRKKPATTKKHPDEVRRLIAHAQEVWSELLLRGSDGVNYLATVAGDTADVLQVASLVNEGQLKRASEHLTRMDTAPRSIPRQIIQHLLPER